MSLPWSAQQLEWLREMGFEVLAQRSADAAVDRAAEDERATGDARSRFEGEAHRDAGMRPGASPSRDAGLRSGASPRRGSGDASAPRISPALQRIARGVDLVPLLAVHSLHDAASRRAFWRALRPLRKAARTR